MTTRFILAFLVVSMAAGCSPSPPPSPPVPAELGKIKFSLRDIAPDGLRGLPDGQVAVAYEFCVPRDDRLYAEIRRLDPSVQIHPGSRGRSGCGNDQALCTGSTHQPGWLEVLRQLAALTYVTEIRECFFE